MSRGRIKDRRAIRKRRTNLSVVALVVLVLCCVIAYQKIGLKTQEKKYAARLEELEKEKAAEEKRTEEIEDYKVYVQSKQYIEQEARDKLGLTYPDEIVFEAEE